MNDAYDSRNCSRPVTSGRSVFLVVGPRTLRHAHYTHSQLAFDCNEPTILAVGTRN